MNVKSLTSIFAAFLLVLLPFWDVMVPLVTYISPSLFYVVGPIRYELFFVSFLISLFVLLDRKVVLFNHSVIILLAYFFIMVFSLATSSTSIVLKLEAVKLQLLIVLFSVSCLFVFSFRGGAATSFIPSFHFLEKTFMIQLILVLLVGLVEFFDQSILQFLYAKPLDEIQHIHFLSFPRLISLIGNPINLGAFILVCLSFNLRFFLKAGNYLLKLMLLVLCFFVLTMTLSRMAVLCLFLFIVMIIVFSRGKVRVLYFLFFLIIASALAAYISTIDLGAAGKRMIDMASSDAYSGNSRVDNWYLAISKMRGVYDVFFGLGFGRSNPSSEYNDSYDALMIENAFVSIYVDLGVLGLFVFVLLCLRFLMLSFLFYKKIGNPAFISFFVVFTLFSMTNDFNRNMPFSFYFFYFVAWLECYFLQRKCCS